MLLHRQFFPCGGSLLLLHGFRFSCNHQHVLSSGFMCFIPQNRLLQSRLPFLFKLFCQLPAKCQRTVSQHLTKFPQRCLQMMGRFIQYNRPRLTLQFLQHSSALFFVLRQKRFKGKSPAGLSRGSYRRNASRRPRHSVDFNSSLVTHRHQLLSRIRNPGRPCICNQGDMFPLLQLLQKDLSLLHLVKFMVACHGGLDIKTRQQLQGISRILRSDQIRLFQNTYRTKRHILQIADRRGTQIKYPAHTTPPFLCVHTQTTHPWYKHRVFHK